MLKSYRIPINFVVHSIWLYKNKLMGFIIQEYEDNKELLHPGLKDFGDFFQIIMQKVSEGFAMQTLEGSSDPLSELKEFRELSQRKGCILVVDNDEMNRIVSKDILEFQDYRVILAENGEQALDILSEKGD